MSDWGVEYYSDKLGKFIDFSKSTAYEYMGRIEVGTNDNGHPSWSTTVSYTVPQGGELVAMANCFAILEDDEYMDMFAQTLGIEIISNNQVHVWYDEAESGMWNNPRDVYVYVYCKMPKADESWGVYTSSGDFSLITKGEQSLFLTNHWKGSVTVGGKDSVALGMSAQWNEGLTYGWASNSNAVICQHYWDDTDSNGRRPLYIDNFTGDEITVDFYICEFMNQIPVESTWGIQVSNNNGDVTFTSEMVPFQFDGTCTLPGWGDTTGNSAFAIPTTAMLPVAITGFQHAGEKGDDRPTYLGLCNNNGYVIQRKTTQQEYGGNVNMVAEGMAFHYTNYTNYF